MLIMASPRTITIVALSFALGLFFVFMGTIKLTPRLSKDAYSEMVSSGGWRLAARPLFCRQQPHGFEQYVEPVTHFHTFGEEMVILHGFAITLTKTPIFRLLRAC